MQKTVLIALAVVGTLTAGYFLFKNKPVTPIPAPAGLKYIYNQWKVNYKINVGAAEDDFRFKVFSSNYAKISESNRQGKTYTLGLNEFTALTTEEFTATHLGYKTPKTSAQRNVTVLPTTNLTAKADWTGKMNAVKNQGQCGSCWAFSAIGALEGIHSIKKSNLQDLSEQELVDCSGSYGNMGCNGGLMDYAFQYIIDKKGIAQTKEYKYTAADGTCKTTGTTRNAAITGFTDVKVNSAAALKAAIAQQPVSVAIEADTFTFQGYTSGVITGTACGTNLDHGVVAVGYDDTASTPYYNVRNSWGASWGDKGHVKIGIEEGAGVCGIQMAASYPTI